MVEIYWKGEISSSHFLLQDFWGKCRRLHGHNWKVEVWINYNQEEGYINYSDLKKVVMQLDHKIILSSEAIDSREDGRIKIVANRMIMDIPEEYAVVIDGEPTSEKLVNYLIDKIVEAFPNNMIIKVRLWEDENSYAEHLVFRHKYELEEEVIE